MGGMFGQETTTETTEKGAQTSTTKMSQEQKKLLEMIMPSFKDYARRPPELSNRSGIAGFNNQQERAQQMLMDTAREQNQAVNRLGRTNEFLLGDVLDPRSNRYLERSVDAAIRPLQENFQEVVMPGIRGEAITAGQMGSSRQGVAEGIAARALGRQVADTSAKMYGDAYNQGLDAMTRAFALSPQTLSTMALPAQTVASVGDARQAMEQQLINERNYRHMYEQVAPFMAASEIAAIMNGLPGGTTINRGYQAAPQTSAFSGVLGGASTGASLGSAVAPGWGTAIGALLGGGLGYLGSR